MDKTALVNVEVGRGAELLNALDRANLKIDVALWAVLPEYDDWRFVISARQFDALKLREAYRLLLSTLADAGFTPEKTPPLMILPMRDPFIKALRQIFGKAKDVTGMRLGGQMIGDRFIEDALVYRIT